MHETVWKLRLGPVIRGKRSSMLVEYVGYACGYIMGARIGVAIRAMEHILRPISHGFFGDAAVTWARIRYNKGA